MNIYQKLSSALFLFRKLLWYTTNEDYRTAFMGIFHSQLFYVILLWENSLEWQNMFLTWMRAITKSPPLESCRPLFKKTKKYWKFHLSKYYTVYCMRKQIKLNFILVGDTHDRNTRPREKLLISPHRLLLTDKSFIWNSSQLCNKFPQQFTFFKECSFKK